MEFSTLKESSKKLAIDSLIKSKYFDLYKAHISCFLKDLILEGLGNTLDAVSFVVYWRLDQLLGQNMSEKVEAVLVENMESFDSFNPETYFSLLDVENNPEIIEYMSKFYDVSFLDTGEILYAQEEYDNIQKALKNITKIAEWEVI